MAPGFLVNDFQTQPPVAYTVKSNGSGSILPRKILVIMHSEIEAGSNFDKKKSLQLTF